MSGEGAADYQHMLDAGFTRQEADTMRARTSSDMLNAGFSIKEIDDHWGDGVLPTPELDAVIKENIKPAYAADNAQFADNPVKALFAGWDMSDTGLLTQGRPSRLLPQDAPFLNRIMFAFGQAAGDTPAAIAGFFGGGAAGGAGGAAVGTVVAGPPGTIVGGAVGTVVGAGAGSAALPTAIREVYLDQIENGNFKSWSDFWARSAKISYDTAKEGVIGAVSGGIASGAKGKVVRATGSELAGDLASIGTYAATATTIGAGMDGRIPNAEDFTSAAVLMLGFHIAGKTVGATNRLVLTDKGEQAAQGLRDIYRRTGIPPWELAKRAAEDPVIAQEIVSFDANGTPVTPKLNATKPHEPEPFTAKKAAEEPAPRPITEKVSGMSLDQQTHLVRLLENSKDDAISSAGAIGRYQIMPDTARQYGFDPNKLTDPEYNEKVARRIISDLSTRFRKADGSIDQEAVLIAYNAGPGRAIAYRANGRNFSKLPVETQRYLEHAEILGAFKGGGEEPPTGGGKGGGGDEMPKIEGPKEPEDPSELNSEMLASRINDITATPLEPSLVNKAKDLLNRAQFEAVSELTPFKKLDKAMELGENDIGLEDMFRSVYGANGRAGHFIKYGTLSPLEISEEGKALSFHKTSDDYLFKGYEEAKKLGFTVEEVTAYRRALRTTELAKRGIETPTDLKDAEAMIAKVGGKLKPVAELFDRVNDAKIDYMRDSGLLSEKQASAIKDNNRFWIPYNPAKEGEGAYARLGPRFGPTKPIKKIKGGKYQTVDPIPVEIQSFYNAISAADKNRAALSLMKVLTPEAKKGLGLKEIADQRKKADLFDKYGNPIPEPELPLPPLKESQFAYFENGTRHVMEVDDPIIARAIRGGTQVEANTLFRTLRFFAAVKRSGIVEMPDYIARAFMKDAVGSAVLEKWGGASVGQMFDAASHVIKADKVFQDYVAKGGLGTALADMDAQYVARDVYKLFNETGTWQRIANTVSHPLQAVGVIMQRADSIMRLAEQKRQVAAGIDPLKATMRARKINLDFAEKGADPLINVFASITPFFRPSILGIQQLAGAIKNRPLATSMKGIAYITVPTAVLYAMNYLQDEADPTIPEDQKWKNIPHWQKDTMFISPRVGGVRIRLPMPPVVGQVFGGMTNRFLDYFVQEDPHAFGQWAQTMVAQFVPPVIPAIGLPIMEHMANYNSFTGRPLIPASLEGASGYMQYVDYTSETAKQLSRLIGPPNANLTDVSPIVIENYVRQWSGPMGIQALRILDAGLFPKVGKPWEFADVPVVGAFTVRNPGMSAQPIQDFYDGFKEVEKARKDFALARNRMNETELDETSEQDLTFFNLQQTADALSMQRSTIDAVNRDEEMTADDKRQIIENIYELMILESKTGLEIIDEAKR